MRTCVIVNPAAGTAGQASEVRESMSRRPGFVVRETRDPGHARQLAAQALKEGFERVVAAGGDGTVNEVVNGLSADFSRATLGIVPLGTGNDLPRTLAIPEDPAEALALLDVGVNRTIDVIKVRGEGKTSYCINVAAGGFSGQVDEALTGRTKETWGPLAYFIGAAKALPDLTQYKTQIRLDGKSWEQVLAMNVIVANGRTAAGGIVVASEANPEDGLLDVVIVRPGSVLKMTGVATRLLAGDYLHSDLVTLCRAKRVEVRSEPGMWFNIDGELLTREPVTFSVVPNALRVIVGPDYTPSPTDARGKT